MFVERLACPVRRVTDDPPQYVKMAEPNWYGGIYIWDSMESLSAYRHSDLASTIPAAYRVKGTPKVEILNCLMPLREPR